MLGRTLLIAAALAAGPARAQSYDENPSGRSIYALLDTRLTVADGEPSWLDGGFGKARFGGTADGDARLRARAVEGDLVFQPHLTWSLDATVAVTAQQGQDQPIDLSEGYLSYRHAPIGSVKVSARAGLFWPPVSLEHGGPAWTVTDTITPSAINSWIGEEVKVVGAEGTASTPFGSGRLYGTVALFGFNQTAGALLTYRGWALDDEKATAFGRQPIPPLDSFMRDYQPTFTSPSLQLDHRPGGYAKLGWASRRVKLQAFYYDNRGDPEAAIASKQWGWRTRFGDLGAQVKADARTTVTAQAMLGTTRMGFLIDDRIWIDTRFRSAFLLGTRRLGESTSVSGRVEAFGTRGRGSVEGAETSEDGTALTLAGKRTFGEHLSLLAEVLHVDSRRDERRRVGLDPHQAQTVAQVAARLTL